MELTPLVSGVHKLSRLGRFGRAAAHDDNFQARSSGCRLAAAVQRQSQLQKAQEQRG